MGRSILNLVLLVVAVLLFALASAVAQVVGTPDALLIPVQVLGAEDGEWTAIRRL